MEVLNVILNLDFLVLIPFTMQKYILLFERGLYWKFGDQ
jgi:hypothetical protein